ncbi:hypothetical protein GCM10009696_24910 [Kocuria himachalensis]
MRSTESTHEPIVFSSSCRSGPGGGVAGVSLMRWLVPGPRGACSDRGGHGAGAGPDAAPPGPGGLDPTLPKRSPAAAGAPAVRHPADAPGDARGDASAPARVASLDA